MQTLDLNNLLVQFRNYFFNYPMVTRVDIYKDVVYVEVETLLLAFAIEVNTAGNIELVSRNNTTIQNLSLFLNHPFTKGSLIYKKNVCIVPLFSFEVKDAFIDYSLLLIERTRHILGLCLNVEKSESLRLEHFLIKYQETLALQIHNDVMFNMVEHMQPRLLSIL